MSIYGINIEQGKIARLVPSQRASAGDLLVLETEEDVLNLSGSQLVTVHNIFAKAYPTLGVEETKRFADRTSGARRVWAILLRLQELAKDAKAKPVKSSKRVKGTPTRPLLRDKELAQASKVYPLRPNSVQEKALNLISAEGGITVDEFIAEMNKGPGRPKWTRANAWSSLAYILHRNHGYGLKMHHEVLSAVSN